MSPRNPLIPPLFTPSGSGSLLAAVRRFVADEELFQPGARVLVAVSGGPDSVGLLQVLAQIGEQWDLRLGVAHFDHGLRGEASLEDARFVAELARGLDLPFHGGESDVRVLARTKKVSLQMAARQLRLGFLEQVRRDHGYRQVALGHTADDQVELFFLRLLRGAGAEGLKGMWPRTQGGLVRPLLAVGKEVVLAWLHEERLFYREDLSNLSRRYLRNRVRLDLLPHLQQDYNPRLKSAVWRLMAILQEDERLLAEAAEEAWKTVARWVTPDCATLAIPLLSALPIGLQTRLLRLTLGRFFIHQEITSAQVENLAALAQGQKSGGMIVHENCQVARAGAELHFFSPLPPPPETHPTLLQGIGLIESPDGWRLEARKLTGPQPAERPASPSLAWLDRDQVSFPLTLRWLRPGDRFWPAGSRGSKKMQDFLVDAKIPRWLRPHLPLVASAAGIIWVPGLRLADPVKLTPETANVLELAIAPANPDASRVWDFILAFARKAQNPI
ncbi:MAG: tRNA lysidine(34) synthetase TilS [Desulfobaccales bacterium]